ncbi:GPI mannosyltransferase 2 [Peziza echinospora]|nr:GPI mannosyltransferase 2 [Peziza echinospora]
MPSTTTTTTPLKKPYISLTLLFVITRIALFSLALLTPSPAYDSSTNLILPPPDDANVGAIWLVLTKLAERLTRWDAIYFVKVSERGYLFEQEWAFGWGFTTVVGFFGRVLVKLSPTTIPDPYPYIFSGIVIANISHLFSVFVLYKLTQHVFKGEGERQLSFLAAALHVLSPAGLFLAAPYSESLFSLLTFVGYLIYAKSTSVSATAITRNAGTLLTGVVFSISTMVRSNGLLNGSIFLHDFILELMSFAGEPQVGTFVRIVVLGVSGVLVAVGLAVPQGIAWLDYCTIGEGEGVEKAEWCSHTIPSIYFWVQEKYWNVGLFRYWKVSNIPLFLLAAPMLAILIYSGSIALSGKLQLPVQSSPSSSKKNTQPSQDAKANQLLLLRKLAIPQVLLAVLAIFSYHVQIINRLGSGCVVWYWWVAVSILGDARGVREQGVAGKLGKWTVRWMVMYGLVQAVLFAGFLPPA